MSAAVKAACGAEDLRLQVIRYLSLCLLMFSSSAWAVPFESYLHNREALHGIEKKSYYLAYQELLKALNHAPLNVQLQMNLGYVFELNEEFEKSEKVYRSLVPRVNESELKFNALFNLGNVLGKQKKIDEALLAYQNALKIKPDSVEVKTNIELLLSGGQGEGKGDQQQNKSNQDQNKKQQSDQQEDQKKKDSGQKPKPKPFESQDLTPQDVKRILDEIKNQEQSIRANEYEKGAKDSAKTKDW